MALLDKAPKVDPKATNKPGRKQSNLWVLLSVLVPVACLVLLAAPVVSNIVRFNLPGRTLLTTFMEKIARKDYESAYALYSPQAQEQMSLSDFEAMSNEGSLDGYKGLIVRDFHLQAAYVPDLPDFMADIEGMMFFEGTSNRSFTATLVMIDNHWRIESIQIDSSPRQP